jgi:RNA polymerase-associated protein RTF1
LVNKFIPIERNRISNLMKEAKAQGNEERFAALKKELDDLDGPKLAYSTTMQPSPKKTSTPAGMSQQERLAILNQQNRRKNAEDVRQAQQNERRAAKMTEAALARGEVVVEDHSRRLKTRAKFKHDVADIGVKKTDSERSGTNTPAIGTPNLSAKKPSTPVPHFAKLQDKKGMPTIRRPLMDDDIIGAIDLGIEIDI